MTQSSNSSGQRNKNNLVVQVPPDIKAYIKALSTQHNCSQAHIISHIFSLHYQSQRGAPFQLLIPHTTIPTLGGVATLSPQPATHAPSTVPSSPPLMPEHIPPQPVVQAPALPTPEAMPWRIDEASGQYIINDESRRYYYLDDNTPISNAWVNGVPAPIEDAIEQYNKAQAMMAGWDD